MRLKRPARTVFRLPILSLVILFGGLTCLPYETGVSDAIHLFLTWNQPDTATTMTVNFFHSTKHYENAHIYFDTMPRFGMISDYRYKIPASKRSITGMDRNVLYATLTDLVPDKPYYFSVGNEEIGFSKEFKFKTIPDDATTIRFVSGGDMGLVSTLKLLLKEAAKLEPNFALLGGDIAYDNGNLSNYLKWHEWLMTWQEMMITPAGFLIPMVVAIGNHEVNSGSASRSPHERAPFYYAFFEQHGDLSYFSRQFGKETVIMALDSGHIAPHDGEQKSWLANEMNRYQHLTHKMAVYHVPLYPSYRDFEEVEAGRTHWLSLFDNFQLDLAFENHDHTHKRSKLLRGNQVVSSDGTLYIGDGCWGMLPRRAEERWYLETSYSIPHFWLVDTSQSAIVGHAIGENGVSFDQFQLDVPDNY